MSRDETSRAAISPEEWPTTAENVIPAVWRRSTRIIWIAVQSDCDRAASQIRETSLLARISSRRRHSRRSEDVKLAQDCSWCWILSRTNAEERIDSAPMAAHWVPWPVETPRMAAGLGLARIPTVVPDFQLNIASLASILDVSCSVVCATLLGRLLLRKSVKARSETLTSLCVLRWLEKTCICVTNEPSDARRRRHKR